MEYELTMEDMSTIVMSLEDEIRKETEYQSNIQGISEMDVKVNPMLIRLQSVFSNLSTDYTLEIIEPISLSNKRFLINKK